ncbi:MAG: TetR/AcrR family transcriptional regulator [Anaerolineales bacterium]|nr:TetR/AcrR family transcriptional regulator [Chloroflexota bacterium]MBL6980503.1 TetR/AcrR family transcriptional regulator [Anaerolineales bacterium]
MPKGIPLTNEDRELRRSEIAHAAADLIFEKGFTETSVNQIAKAAGIGKSTLYDFFSNKDEIILYLMEKFLIEVTSRAKAIIAGEGSVIERLRRVMQMHLEFLLRNKAFILKLTLETQRLSIENQKIYQVKRYAYQDLLIELIEQGIADGSFRQIDSGMLMKTLLAAMSPVVYTSRPVGTPQEMLDKTLNLILEGAKTSDS